MPKLNAFRTSPRLLRDGDWVDLGDDFDGLRLKVRGQGHAYFDARARAIARAAQSFAGDTSRIAEDEMDRIAGAAAADHLLIDVDGLQDAEGAAITVDAYRGLMLQPEYAPLVAAVLVASDRLARRARAEAQAAAGNSQPPSAGG
jgi:hypothetical protein